MKFHLPSAVSWSFLLACWLVNMSPVLAGGTTTVRVGPASDPACDFQNIQDAIDADHGGNSQVRIFVSGPEELHLGNTYSLNMASFEEQETWVIRGAFSSCSADSPEPGARTVLNADNNGRVWTIRYPALDSDPIRHVLMDNFEMRRGFDQDSTGGGGILIRGHAGRQRVTLENIVVDSNRTTESIAGGGILVEASDSSADADQTWVSMRPVGNDGVMRVSNNRSLGFTGTTVTGHGGGIACINDTDLPNGRIRIRDITIANNRALNNGGGVYIDGCTDIRIETESTLLGSIALNQTGSNGGQGQGGGIYVGGGGDVTISASSAEHAARISDNLALTGGGVAVVGIGSSLELDNTVIAGNHANASGGGVFLDERGFLNMGRFGNVAFVPPATCTLPGPNPPCSAIQDNTSGRGGGISVFGFAEARIDQTFLHGNGSVGLGDVAEIRQGGKLSMEGAAIYGNEGDRSLFQLQGGELELTWSTIAGNGNGEKGGIFNLFQETNIDSELTIHGSIIWEPDAVDMIRDTPGSISSAVCIIAHTSAENSGFDNTKFYSQIDPGLQDPENGDLSVQLDSPAIDYCGEGDFPPQFGDMFNNPRNVPLELPTVPAPNPGNGAFDLGVYEQQSVEDAVFNDRFEE